MNDINEIKQALEKATPGPWFAVSTEIFIETGPIAKLWGEGSKGEFRFDNYLNNGTLIVNAPMWLSSLITTIESQEKFISNVQDQRDKAYDLIDEKDVEIESLKAITELAVKGLKKVKYEAVYGFLNKQQMIQAMYDTAEATISEITKLQNE